ncbi:MBL fold metallo-hydrolase [Pedobacter borealis]|uniref:MBL fold metallo-hydrolase n=1 Tax=Pedobacter borealis TaxID=475254 RepID=UPI00049396C4|nr:MBL fold metallo-hydrolase [Pedobacter borealis]
MKSAFLSFLLLISISAQSQVKQFLLPWEKGMMDIHFISNGVGNCAFYILPDGTTLLVDAGEEDPTSARTNSPRNTPRYPNYSKLGHEWQTDYIDKLLKSLHQDYIDYALISHYHGDHFGSLYKGMPKSENGDYYLTGITGVGDKIKIKKLIDRGYRYPTDMRKQALVDSAHFAEMINYWKFTSAQQAKNNLKHEDFIVGSKSQFSLTKETSKFTNFSISNINANGVVWTGKNDGSVISRMPPVSEGRDYDKQPGDNPLSCGIKIKYGNFSLYTGGDIAGKQPDFMQAPEWIDVESLVAPTIGEVDVATCNHHANRDAMSAYYLSVLKPRVIVQEVWSSDHPGHETLLRMTSKNIWPAERDLFATNMLLANKLVIGELVDKSYKSTQGHIVIRVLPPGDKYYVYILNNETTEGNVTNVFGPYYSKSKLNK